MALSHPYPLAVQFAIKLVAACTLSADKNADLTYELKMNNP